MWIKKEGEEEHPQWSYISNGDIICHIFPKYTYVEGIHPRKNKGYIYYDVNPAMAQQEGEAVALYDNDLDVLKLKCLVKAKEIGWNIKEMV